MLEIPGVIAVHDLHVRTITSGVDSLTGHLVVREMKDAATVLKRAKVILEEMFRIAHATIQLRTRKFGRQSRFSGSDAGGVRPLSSAP